MKTTKFSGVSVECVQIYKVGGRNDGCVLGYLIHNSGEWEAWKIETTRRYDGQMTRVTIGTNEQALAAFVRSMSLP